MSRSASRLAILGAGPVGLEAALRAARLGLSFRVYERGEPGQHLRHWGHVRLFTPFGMNSTAQGRAAILAESPGHRLPAESDLITGRDHVAAYLEPLALCSALAPHIQTGTTVLGVARQGYLKEELSGDPRRAAPPFRLLLRGGDGKERVELADVVLDCTGTYGSPRHPGDGGLPAVGELALGGRIARGVEDVLGEKRDHYAGRTVLVVGAGHSAATTVRNLAALAEKHPETWIIWLARGAGSQPLRRQVNDPLRERDALCARANTLATRGEGNVEFHPRAVVQAIEAAGEGLVVTALVGGQERVWQVDRMIANVGNEPDNGLYRQLQVPGCGASTGPVSLRHPEPNFYIVGSKSYGGNTTFLLRDGFEQVREVFSLITGKPDAGRGKP